MIHPVQRVIQEGGFELAPLLAELHAAASEPLQEVWDENAFFSLLSMNGVRAFVAGRRLTFDGDWSAEPGAFALFRATPPEAEVILVATARDCRRQGLAWTLLRHAHREMEKRSVEEVFLEVASDNRAAIALYERLGYRRVGLRKGYYARPIRAVDAWTMRLDLLST
ncbi:MAG: GNAT family N-acetyltransferase [Rhodospirillales bacterium]